MNVVGVDVVSDVCCRGKATVLTATSHTEIAKSEPIDVLMLSVRIFNCVIHPLLSFPP